ncbi:MAG: hypothetical protein ACOYKE_11765 [Ferruginibacter sp.]
MQTRKYVLVLLLLLSMQRSWAQSTASYESVDAYSYQLYEKAEWKPLLEFGKEAIGDGQDFVLLRLRMGYASFMLGNYSAAIKQYEAVLKKDSYNTTAHYYIWLCRVYLNQGELAGSSIKNLDKTIVEQNKLKGFAISEVGIESSYKIPDITVRENGMYNRLDIKNRWGNNVYMEQGFALFNQTLDEPLLSAVTNNNNIAVNQKEYYNKLTVNLNKRLQFKLAYHYLYTPFNNYIYNNHLGMAGIRYYGNYFDIQADAVVGMVTDTLQQQINLQLSVYPTGNKNFYSITTGMFRNRNSVTGLNLKQVLGVKVLKGIWLEGNATLGMFSNLAENDALYIYNAIDRNKMKAGATVYVAGKRLTFQAGYTFEQRELYKQPLTFNQHSITGGLSWKF